MSHANRISHIAARTASQGWRLVSLGCSLTARAVSADNKSYPAVFLITVMISTVSVLMAAHAVEVFIWALAYLIVGVVPGKAGFVYFAFVNYTTLGYGDILPVERWRLLGPITALNGVLLIGWSTAVIFEVLRRALARTETPK